MGKDLKKILLLSSGDTFGAYEWVYRMTKILNEEGYQAIMLVKDKRRADEFIIKVPIEHKRKSYIQRSVNLTKRKLNIKQSEFLTDSKYVFLPGEDETNSIADANHILSYISFVPDIIVSGMTDGFLGTETLSQLKDITRATIFQGMVDMSLLTGGCHVVWDCKGFETDCANCPAVLDTKFKNVPQKNLSIKYQNIKKANIQLIAGEGWTRMQAKKSLLFKEQKNWYNLNGYIDFNVFNNKHRSYAKQIFDIDANSKLLFIGSNNIKDERKGLRYFVEALDLLYNTMDITLRNKIVILIAGNHNTETELTKKIKFKKHLIDFISDYRLLSLAYQASDVFVCPSLEDGGPMMVTEALACGTPVVGFKMGLLYDHLVDNEKNGYVAEMKNSTDLAFGINKILSLTDKEFNFYSVNATEIIQKNYSKEANLKALKEMMEHSNNN